jgi:hypothetical protein
VQKAGFYLLYFITCTPILHKNVSLTFDVCVTVRHWYNNINSQLDATITVSLIISISSTCFGR